MTDKGKIPRNDIPVEIVDFLEKQFGIRLEGTLVSCGYAYDELLEDEVIDVVLMIKPKEGTNGMKRIN